MSTHLMAAAADDTPSQKSTTWTQRWRTGPPGTFFTVVTALTAVGTLITYSDPGQQFPGFLYLFESSAGIGVFPLLGLPGLVGDPSRLWPLLGLVWVARFVLNLVARDSRNSLRSRPFAWLLAPAIAAIVTGMLLLQVPVRVGALLG